MVRAHSNDNEGIGPRVTPHHHCLCRDFKGSKAVVPAALSLPIKLILEVGFLQNWAKFVGMLYSEKLEDVLIICANFHNIYVMEVVFKCP